MSATVEPPPHVLVARDEPLAELKAALATVRRDENARKWWAAAAVLVPWFIAVAATGFAVCGAFLVWSRPVPHDHFILAAMHADNTYDPIVERDDLPVSRRKVLLDYSVIHFVEAWENYAWRANNGNYKFISAVTAGEDLQRQYQSRFSDSNKNSPLINYGQTTTRDVVALHLSPVPSAPYAMDVMMLIKLRRGGEPTCQRWTARLTFKDDTKGVIPVDIQKLYDPMDIIFVSYDSNVDASAPDFVACPTS